MPETLTLPTVKHTRAQYSELDGEFNDGYAKAVAL